METTKGKGDFLAALPQPCAGAYAARADPSPGADLPQGCEDEKGEHRTVLGANVGAEQSCSANTERSRQCGHCDESGRVVGELKGI